jgi:hypothetical protein
MWTIKFKDINPDTGETSQEVEIAVSADRTHADAIVWAMNYADEEPNREYFAIHETNRI